MTCSLFSMKPSNESVLIHCQWTPENKLQISSWTGIWKCLQNDSRFVQALCFGNLPKWEALFSVGVWWLNPPSGLHTMLSMFDNRMPHKPFAPIPSDWQCFVNSPKAHGPSQATSNTHHQATETPSRTHTMPVKRGIKYIRVHLTKYHAYRQVSNIRRTKPQTLNVSCLVLQLSLSNPLKPGIKSRMKM